MNKKIRWIIIGIVAVIIIAISIMAIINEVQLHYKVEEISEYKYFTLEQNKKYGVIDKVSDRGYVSNSFHCHVTEDIGPI